MNKELAKKLRDAGFPIHECNAEPAEHYECKCGAESFRECIPTLSELIEACGKYFFCLKKSQGKSRFGWMVESTDKEGFMASTPEESVANLWLALNKK